MTGTRSSGSLEELGRAWEELFFFSPSASLVSKQALRSAPGLPPVLHGDDVVAARYFREK